MFLRYLIIATLLYVLPSCYRGPSDENAGGPKLVGLDQYLDVQECWGRTTSNSISFDGRLIINPLPGDQVNLFPLSDLCSLDPKRTGQPSFAFVGNVRISGVRSHKAVEDVFEFTSITDELSHEAPPINAAGILVDASFRCQSAVRDGYELYLKNCEITRVRNKRTLSYSELEK